MSNKTNIAKSYVFFFFVSKCLTTGIQRRHLSLSFIEAKDIEYLMSFFFFFFFCNETLDFFSA